LELELWVEVGSPEGRSRGGFGIGSYVRYISISKLRFRSRLALKGGLMFDVVGYDVDGRMIESGFVLAVKSKVVGQLVNRLILLDTRTLPVGVVSRKDVPDVMIPQAHAEDFYLDLYVSTAQRRLRVFRRIPSGVFVVAVARARFDADIGSAVGDAALEGGVDLDGVNHGSRMEYTSSTSSD
jgi:hypothetical protein